MESNILRMKYLLATENRVNEISTLSPASLMLDIQVPVLGLGP